MIYPSRIYIGVDGLRKSIVGYRIFVEKYSDLCNRMPDLQERSILNYINLMNNPIIELHL